jgi:hypothetical protein
MKHLAVALCLVLAVAGDLSAELKYTVHMQIKKAEGPGGQPPANPMVTMLADGLTRQMLPGGSADVIYIVGERGMRIEFLQSAMGNPAGTITVTQPDGTLLVLNPKEQTYWKTSVSSAAAAMQGAGVTPDVTAKRTGEFSTVAGVRCERVTFDWKMDLPIPEAARASLPPDFPTALVMSGDGCSTTDRFQKYAQLASKSRANEMMALLGFDKMMQGGILLRQNVRLVGVELQSVVTEIAEADLPASLFELPEAYKETAPPARSVPR